MTRYRDIWFRYRYIPILIPISGIPDIGYTRYRVCPDIGMSRYRISRYRDMSRYRVSAILYPISGSISEYTDNVPISGFGKVPDVQLIFLLLQLLYISEQLAGGPYLNLCTANHRHCTIILRDQVNIRPMSTA
jgi:hypothetical protein